MSFTRMETSARTARSYELRLSAADDVHGAASAGAPFNVYLRNLKDGGGGMMVPRHMR